MIPPALWSSDQLADEIRLAEERVRTETVELVRRWGRRSFGPDERIARMSAAELRLRLREFVRLLDGLSPPSPGEEQP